MPSERIEEAHRGDGDESGYWWWVGGGKGELFVDATIEAAIRADVDADVRALMESARNATVWLEERGWARGDYYTVAQMSEPLRAALAKFEEVARAD